jgi:hypothetical protein
MSLRIIRLDIDNPDTIALERFELVTIHSDLEMTTDGAFKCEINDSQRSSNK